MSVDRQRNPTVVVIGAGMTGILLAIKLKEAGISDVHIFEKSHKVGGTWRENTYPGVACDVPAPMYTYSFEPNPNWSHLFAHGDEIQQYFEGVADKYGVTERVNFNESVTSCVYDNAKWTVTSSKGKTLVADFVINSTGILHHPKMPDIEGIATFRGSLFHTAQWDHSVELAGQRIGIIGTGSTASQVIPELTKVATKLSVFQRTPQWVLPLGNRKVSEQTKQTLRSNPKKLARLKKFYNWGLAQLLTKAVIGKQPQRFLFSQICKNYMRFAVKDPDLRKKLTPDYAVGCKRIIISNTFIPALQASNVDVVTEGIERITERGVLTKDGREHELDVLVLSTGFDPVAYMRPMEVKGRDGLDINQAWEHKIKTYRSICLPGFPNNFLMLGPNSPIGNYSVIEMSEVQTGYLLKLIDHWRQGHFDAIEPKQTAVDSFTEYMKAGLAGTVWVGGCQSWYMDQDGDPILWPYSFGQWVKEMREPQMADFDLIRV
ncbi:MAG: monooxygenase [Gammaproteobacteria bacterium]|nr:MAG: monooxygenase [Gammaproteobacteria bacterium]